MTDRIIPAVAITLIAVTICVSCGGDGDGRTVPCDESPVDTAGVPELADGVLNIGSSVAFPPIDFYRDDGAPDGLDVDLADALAEKLCVSVEFVDTPFDQLIGGLVFFDFDVVMSAMTITEERSQRTDFVPYANVGTSIIVRSGSPDGIAGGDDLCGKTVAVQKETIHDKYVRELPCELGPEGPGPVDVVEFDLSGDAVRDVVTAGSDATITDFPAAFVHAEEDPRLRLVDVQICPQPYGIGVRKDSRPLNAVITEGLLAIHEAGTYDEIMKKWDLGQARLDLPTVLTSDGLELASACIVSGE